MNTMTAVAFCCYQSPKSCHLVYEFNTVGARRVLPLQRGTLFYYKRNFEIQIS